MNNCALHGSYELPRLECVAFAPAVITAGVNTTANATCNGSLGILLMFSGSNDGQSP